MIPQNQILQTEWLTFAKQPSWTYRMREVQKEVRGDVDGLLAVKQAVAKILSTERYQYVIYDWNYGVEFSDLWGKPMSYVIPEVEQRITEALCSDDRIESVTDFRFTQHKSDLTVSFHVQTLYGDWEEERTVQIAYV